MACDKHSLGEHVLKASQNGHQAVSESLTTLRLRCAEPVRFRLLIGILNSGGGSGELQYVGMRFINTFTDSADSLQTRLYLQAELFQAGLEPHQMSKLISSTSPWLEKLVAEIKRWDSIKIDIEQLHKQIRNAEQCRSKLVILERKVEMLQEEKNIFTTIERRLQEKCADLQRELMQVKKTASTTSTLEKPVALPRQTIIQNTLKKKNSSEDEGISSSETGQSSSPIPQSDYKNESNNSKSRKSSYDDDSNTTIDDVIEELTNIVNDAEREIKERDDGNNFKPIKKSRSEDLLVSTTTTAITSENDSMIIPCNLLPQPPKKSNKSLIHIMGPQHDMEGSDYDYYIQNTPTQPQKDSSSIYENDYELDKNHPDIVSTTHNNNNKEMVVKHGVGGNRQKDDNNRQLLNVIMDAREKEQQHSAYINRAHSLERDIFPPQQFNGVFFMSDMNPMTPGTKFSKPDIMAAIESKRASKNFGVNSMIDVVMTSQEQKALAFHQQQVKSRQIFLPAAHNNKFSQPSSVTFNNFKFKNTNVNPSLFFDKGGPNDGLVTECRTQSNNGSKVTDLISGLY